MGKNIAGASTEIKQVWWKFWGLGKIWTGIFTSQELVDCERIK